MTIKEWGILPNHTWKIVKNWVRYVAYMQLHATEALLATHSYPTTTHELIETFGETELSLQNGTETIGDVLSLFGEEHFENSEAVTETLLTGVSHKAIGRRFYSDRDQFTPGEYGPEPVSF